MSYISFRMVLAPKYTFIGGYIQPEGARYSCPSMFANITKLIEDSHAKGLIPYLGDDFNSHLGDINLLIPGSSWKYLKNVDSVTNRHGRTFFKDMRITADIKPINCLKHKQILVDGNSQIDFVLTDSHGRQNIEKSIFSGMTGIFPTIYPIYSYLPGNYFRL